MISSITSVPIIVIGASTGGVRALKTILAELPARLPAAVLVVVHRSEQFPDHLAEILQSASALPVALAVHGEAIEAGRVYLAPPDNHLLARSERLEVVRGPRENGSRPAVNPLFRTAAASHGSRVIGVVLTGHLDCGTAGAGAIKAQGGFTIAQDPETAECGEMPASAIRSGAIDEILRLEAIPGRLIELVQEKHTAEQRLHPAPASSVHSLMTCPSCHGSMTESAAGPNQESECHVGHRFSLRSLYAEQADEVESALWAATRALEEAAFVAKRLTETSTGSMKQRFAERARVMTGYARTLTELLLGFEGVSRADVTGQGWDRDGAGKD